MHFFNEFFLYVKVTKVKAAPVAAPVAPAPVASAAAPEPMDSETTA